MQPQVTVVLPTYNEAANIGDLLHRLRDAFLGVDVELLVVDDASPDGTADAARAADPRARVVVRSERGLATAVVAGIRAARAPCVLVMDTDFQHPVEAARALYDTAVAESAQLVVGSRYAPGGDDGAFSWPRRAISKGAARLSRLALPPLRQHGLTDPMSGLFLIARDAVDVDRLRPQGYKILLEILARCRFDIVREVPYAFAARQAGASKLGPAVILQYLLHLIALGVTHPDNQRPARFALVGVSGIVVNLAVLVALREGLGWHHLAAAVVSVETSILTNFFLNDRFTFRDRRREHTVVRLLRFNGVSVGAMAVNLATLFLFADVLRFHYLPAELIAIVASFGFNYLGNLNWTYGGVDRFRVRRALWRVRPLLPVFLIAGGAFALFTWDLDRADEIYFDEHYYISVAHQIDNGIWEDPCWQPISVQHRPLNFEHPPLAKLIMAWSVETFDTDHSVFQGCRSPDDNTPLQGSCRVLEDGQPIQQYDSSKQCYDGFTQRLRDFGNPYAWRMPSVVMGTAAVLFAGLTVARLTRSPGAGALAGAFIAMDGVMLTSSRLAILDIYAAGFAMVALWAATWPGRRGVIGSALGLAFAFACKFTAVFAGIPVLVLLLWTQWRHGRLTRRMFDGTVAAYAVIPNLLLAVTYAPWWRIWIPELGLWGAVKHWFSILGDAITWGTTVPIGHAYGIRPWAWFSDARPTFYYAMWSVDGVAGINRYIYAVGNPILWWAAALSSLIVVPGLIVWSRTRGGGAWKRLWQTQTDTQVLFIATLLPILVYAPFLALTRETFLFYMTIIVPFLAIGLAVTLWWIWQRRGAIGRVAAAAVVLLVVGAFLFYYPVTVGLDLHEDRFQMIMDALPWMRE